jgi:hypothetical protein
MKTRNGKSNEGMALVVSVIFLVMMGILATWATARVMDNARNVDKYSDYADTFQGVEAGMATAIAELDLIDNGIVGTASDGIVGMNPAGYNFALGAPAWTNAAVAPLTPITHPEIQYFAYSLNWATDGLDNNGNGQTDEAMEQGGYFSTYAFARAIRNNSVSAVRASEQLVQGINVNVWQNAIFAGAGQAGLLINGNVGIHGSVHVLGDNLNVGGIALDAIDLSGGAGIFNNYSGLSADLAGRVPALPTTVFNGETVSTLNTTLRVKEGLVGLSGTAQVGAPDATGNSVKETVMGVYVTDGWTGNKGSGPVYSDNGTSNAYDLGNKVPFPTYTNDANANFLSKYTTFDSTAGQGLHAIHSGDMTIQSTGGNYYWDATTGTEVVNKALGANGMPTKAALDSTHNYVWYDDATKTMVINGRIPVNGDIKLVKGGGQNNLINYEGKGTLLTYDPNDATNGDVEVTVNLKTTAFPGTNLLGVMAQHDLLLGIGSQLEFMGGFYAQNRIGMDKQSVLMGTIVGNYFDMGGQVPSIYQVPALSNSWTADQMMIGSGPVVVLQPVSWRELAIL